jgi:hypothetical protein
MSLNYFSNGTVADGTNVTSYINQSSLISAIQSDYLDSYLDATNQFWICFLVTRRYSRNLAKNKDKGSRHGWSPIFPQQKSNRFWGRFDSQLIIF